MRICIRHEEMNQEMSSLGQSIVAMDILRPFLRKVNCRLCHNVLLEECTFPQDLVLLVASSNVVGSYPSKVVKSIIKDVYNLAGSNLSRDLHVNLIRKTFFQNVNNLPSVKSFKLCLNHNEKERTQLIQHVARKALVDLLNRVNADIRKQLKIRHGQKAIKKSAKLQRVTNQ